jgi:hypothetical protein
MLKLQTKTIIIIFSLFFLFAFLAMAKISWAEIISSDRRIAWEGNVGVSGDIPARAAICRTLSPSGGDDTSAIQNAIDACPSGQVVKLNTGNYSLGGQLTFKSNITLRGSGMGVTNIIGAPGSRAYLTGLFDFNGSGGSWDLSGSTVKDLQNGYTKGSTIITTTTTHGLSAGDVVVIDQLNSDSTDPPVTITDSEGCGQNCGRSINNSAVRSLGQVDKIKNVLSSTQVELEIPLYSTYSSSLAPQVVKIAGLLTGVGLEDLTLNNVTSKNDVALSFNGTQNSWMLRVEVNTGPQMLVRFWQTYRNTVRSCIFHGDPGVVIPGGNYGLILMGWNGADLIEDNSFYQLGIPIIMDGVTSGNVFAYNYMLAKSVNAGDTWRQLGVISFHGAHPNMNLFEGNIWRGMIFADFYHGSSAYNTFFRNKGYLEVKPPEAPYTQMNWLMGIYKKAHYYNMIGNIFGTVGFENRYEATNGNANYETDKAIYYLGYPAASGAWNPGTTPYGPPDTQTEATLYRHGNWDSVSNGIVWDNQNSDHVLPSSLYLTSAPRWWCSQSTWPPVNPAGPTVSDIPAKRKYDGVACNLITADTIPPAAPANVRVN